MSESDPPFFHCRPPKNKAAKNRFMKDILKHYEPTPEDFKRKFTDKELKELCLKVKCRVAMTRFNPVHEYAEFYRKNGRFKNKSADEQLYLLAKSINRNKEKYVYEDKEIQSALKGYWGQCLKDNIMRLDLWEYDRQQAEKKKKNAAETTNSNSVIEVISLESLESQNGEMNNDSEFEATIQGDVVNQYLIVATESMTIPDIITSQSVPELGSEVEIYEDFQLQISKKNAIQRTGSPESDTEEFVLLSTSSQTQESNS